MKKYIILSGSLLLIVVMLLTPSIPAMEYKTIKDKIQSDSYIKLEGMQKNIEEIKSLLKNFNINYRFILMILIRGILLPVLSFGFTLLIADRICAVSILLYAIIAETIDLITIKFTLKYIWDWISAETGSDLLGLMTYIILTIIDIILANLILKYLTNHPELNASVSGLRSRIESLLNVG
jgi:uncharacterized membrane protein